MKKSVCMAMAALAFSAAGAGCAGAQGTGGGAAAAGVPKVYMFEEINSENLVKKGLTNHHLSGWGLCGRLPESPTVLYCVRKALSDRETPYLPVS